MAKNYRIVTAVSCLALVACISCVSETKPTPAKQYSRLSFEELLAQPASNRFERWKTAEHFSSQLNRNVPMIYVERFRPLDPELDSDAIDRIIERASAQAAKGQSIWFIWVGSAHFFGAEVAETGVFLSLCAGRT